MTDPRSVRLGRRTENSRTRRGALGASPQAYGSGTRGRDRPTSTPEVTPDGVLDWAARLWETLASWRPLVDDEVAVMIGDTMRSLDEATRLAYTLATVEPNAPVMLREQIRQADEFANAIFEYLASA